MIFEMTEELEFDPEDSSMSPLTMEQADLCILYSKNKFKELTNIDLSINANSDINNTYTEIKNQAFTRTLFKILAFFKP